MATIELRTLYMNRMELIQSTTVSDFFLCINIAWKNLCGLCYKVGMSVDGSVIIWWLKHLSSPGPLGSLDSLTCVSVCVSVRLQRTLNKFPVLILPACPRSVTCFTAECPQDCTTPGDRTTVFLYSSTRHLWPKQKTNKHRSHRYVNRPFVV